MNKNARIALIAAGTIVVIALIAWVAMRQATPKQQPPPPLISLQSTPQEPELVSVPRTPLATAKQEVDGAAVLVIDVRDADSYIAAHVPGALQIPLARIEGEVNYLPRNKPILTYCT